MIRTHMSSRGRFIEDSSLYVLMFKPRVALGGMFIRSNLHINSCLMVEPCCQKGSSRYCATRTP
jgi:hypothetical protein